MMMEYLSIAEWRHPLLSFKGRLDAEPKECMYGGMLLDVQDDRTRNMIAIEHRELVRKRSITSVSMAQTNSLSFVDSVFQVSQEKIKPEDGRKTIDDLMWYFQTSYTLWLQQQDSARNKSISITVTHTHTHTRCCCCGCCCKYIHT
jgi:hypothetical protein